MGFVQNSRLLTNNNPSFPYSYDSRDSQHCTAVLTYTIVLIVAFAIL